MKPLSLLLLSVVAFAQQVPLTIAPATSYDPSAGVAPESIVSAFGENLAIALAVADYATLPTQLGSTTVAVTDSRGTSRPAPLFAVSPKQVNFLIPAGTAAGTTTVTVRNGAISASGSSKSA